jgi:hypothetical protein
MYQSYILDQTPAIFLDTRLSNIYQSYLLDQEVIKVVDTRLSNMYQSYALDQDILRFNFSGIPILSSGFISQKFINLYINSSQVTMSGSQWEGYKVQLQNTVTNETKDLLVEQTGNYILFKDDILLQDYNDYNIKIGFVYSQEQSPSPFTNYVNIPQFKPPSQVLNASIASPDDWELARTRLNLTWNTPLNSGSSSILGYQIKQSGFADSIRASGLANIDTFINISGLISGRSYIYDIRSFNLHGLSDPVFVSGNTSSIVKLSGIIDINTSLTVGPQKSYSSTTLNASGQLDILSNAPTNLVGSPSNSKVSLSWTPSNNIKGTLSNYLVYYRLSGQQTQTVFTNSTNSTYNLAQLINSSTYYITIAPIYYDYANVISTGDFSQTILSTPFIQPVEPIYLANGFISTINIDTVNDPEFPNAAISNGFISVLTSDTINQNEFSNAALSNGYLSALYIDTISISPPVATLTVSPSSGTSDFGTAYSWSGAGTAASPLETSDAASPNGIPWTWAGGANTYRVWQFTCGVSGTLTFELGAGFDGDGGAERPNFERYLRNGVQSTTFVGGTTNLGDHYIRRSLSVSAGDVIRLGRASPFFGFAGSEMLKGKIRLWIS